MKNPQGIVNYSNLVSNNTPPTPPPPSTLHPLKPICSGSVKQAVVKVTIDRNSCVVQPGGLSIWPLGKLFFFLSILVIRVTPIFDYFHYKGDFYRL